MRMEMEKCFKEINKNCVNGITILRKWRKRKWRSGIKVQKR